MKNSRLALSQIAIRFALGIAALTSTVACGKFQATLDLSGKREATARRHDDESENIADEGEALLLPQSLEKAREKFVLALELNPENTRALFWRDTVNVLLEFKGIVRRVKPLYGSTPDGAARYAAFSQGIAPRYTDAQARFLLSGREDISTPEEAAEFLDRMRLRVDQLRSTVRQIRDTEITLTLPKELIGDKSDQTKTACGIVNFGPIKFRFDDQICSGTNSVPFGVNRADFNAILQMLSIYQLTLDLWTAYRINPVAFINFKNKPINSKADVKEKVLELFTQKLDGSLSRPKPFINVTEMAADTYQAIRYESEHQREVCPAGYPSANNRKGYLLSTGSCTFVAQSRTQKQRTLDVLEAFVAGQPVTTQEGKQLYFQKLIDEPPKNVRDVLPLSVNKCGQVVGFNTKIIKEVYPAFDLNVILAGKSNCPAEVAP